MYGLPRHDAQWNLHRAPHNHNPQWRPSHGHGSHAPFRPRHQGFYNHSPLMQGGREEHWCETCDRGFPSEDLLNKHKQQHQKCNIDGCQFIAHPKVITKHIQMQHSSGLYKKISKLNNPEEIEKWREERRIKYPTKINIEKKAAELKEKIDRGEKMGLGRREWGSKRDNNQNRDFNPGQGNKRSFNNHQPESKFRNRKQAPKRPKILPAPEENRSLAPFAGIQCLAMDSDEGSDENLMSFNDLIEDEIEIIEKAKGDKENVEKPIVCGALSSLMCEYGSSDEEIDNAINALDVKEKEISKVERVSLCHVVKKESVSQKNKKIYEDAKDIQQVKNANEINSKLNEKVGSLPKEVKNTTEIGNKDSEKLLLEINTSETGTKFNDVEKKRAQEVNTHEIVTNSNKVSQNLNQPDLNNDCGCDSEPEEVKMSKNENTIKGIDSSKADELSINNDELNSNNANTDKNDDDSEPEEVKVNKSYESANMMHAQNNFEGKSKIVRKRVEVVRKPVYRKPKPKIPSTLIYKLLSKEMKQERNKILQCIRYIRKNNYFDKST